MRRLCVAAVAAVLSSGTSLAVPDDKEAVEHDKAKPELHKYFQVEERGSDASVASASGRIDYHAVAGVLVVHPKEWDDVPRKPESEDKKAEADAEGEHNPTAEASMSYVAYFKRDAKPEARPVTFLFNGGPGSSSVWLHMGSFGPRRVSIPDAQHPPAAPYQLVPNDQTLLDVSDLVFVDAPGTGFGRLAGKDKQKAFWGVDQDANAFAEFITLFLGKYGRWNSAKYLFGESYGTMRSAVLSNILQSDHDLDLNGVILLSQVLSFGGSVDETDFNPGNDLPFELALPTYAATAWYHHKLPDMSRDLQTVVADAEKFALGDYAAALRQGAALPAADRQQIVGRLHALTGLPTEYIEKANLRVNGGEFEKTLQDDADTTTGRLDTRFSGPTMDPLSKMADYDPQSAAISSAYVSLFNDYVRRELKFGDDKVYKAEIDLDKTWDFQHQPPGAGDKLQGDVNVMPDLAAAMKYNPGLKVMLNAGYYDLATPFFQAMYELRHLPLPAKLQGNIETKLYESGHMVYVNPAALKALHDNVAAFIRRTANVPGL